MLPDLRIISPRTPAELEAVRQLCWEYRAYLMSLSAFDAELVTLFYPEAKYAALMEQIAESHAPPHGFIRLAMLGESSEWCIRSPQGRPKSSESMSQTPPEA